MTREAVLFGSAAPLAGIVNRIRSDIVHDSIHNMRRALESLGPYSFTVHAPLINKRFSDVSQAVNRIRDLDILLLYYVGHGYLTNNQLYLNYPDFRIENINDNWTLRPFLNTALGNRIRNLIVILDCCFAGGAITDITTYQNRLGLYFMGASTSYAYHDKQIGVFTNNLVMALEMKRPPRNLMDASQRAITFKKCHEYVKSRLSQFQHPIEIGSGDIKVRDVEYQPIARFNTLSHNKSLYRKIYYVLNLLTDAADDGLSKYEIKQGILNHVTYFATFEAHTDPNLSKDERLVHADTIEGYLRFCESLGFTAQQNGKWRLSAKGAESVANDGEKFSQVVVESIHGFWDIRGVYQDSVWKAVTTLLENHTQTNTSKILTTLSTDSNVQIRKRELRDTLVLLSYCGIYEKASYDTFFPAFGHPI